MKKIFSIALLLVLFASVKAQNPGLRLLSSDYNQLTVSVVVPELSVESCSYQGEKFSMLTLDGYIASAKEGEPSLPIYSQMIELPICEGTSVSVVSAEFDTIRPQGLLRVMPAQPSRSKSDRREHPIVMDEATYSSDAFFGFDLAEVFYSGIARDVVLGRLAISPVRYNPVTGEIIVCRKAEIKVQFLNSDEGATNDLKRRYHSGAFRSGVETLNHFSTKEARTDAPIRMIVVSDVMFQDSLKPFVEWKRRLGYMVDVVYTTDPEMGNTTTQIQNYLKSQYENATAAKPAQTYVLLVGDVAQIPACDDRYPAQSYWEVEHHPTDLYYAAYTNDMIPDCYYGRFSAQNVAQLVPQIQKTLMYEQYTFPDPSFLDTAVLVAGIDGGQSSDYGYNYADPTMDYIARNYVNGDHGFSYVSYFKNNPDNANTPEAANVEVFENYNAFQVREAYSAGAGLINYSAHGNWNEWSIPSFTTTHIASMTNNYQFGIMIGNCCLSNKFDKQACFGESLLRKDEYAGAAGYIGASNYTYWSEDVYWSVGVRTQIRSSLAFQYDAQHLGMYDQLFHLNNEPQSKWITSFGAMMMTGNMAVESSNSGLKNYYWEVYHIMGDPSLQPWIARPQEMAEPVLLGSFNLGNAQFEVQTVANAYVAVTKGGRMVCAAFADADGRASMSIPSAEAGTYELAVSAMGYRPHFSNITVRSLSIRTADAQVRIAPNPASEMVTISLAGMNGIDILDASGRVVKSVKVSSDEESVKVSDLPKGIYFVKVKSDNNVFVNKFVRQ